MISDILCEATEEMRRYMAEMPDTYTDYRDEIDTVYAAMERLRIKLDCPTAELVAIFERDHYRCRLCGAGLHHGVSVQVGIAHITLPIHGGNNDPSNLFILCMPCKEGRGDQFL